MEVALCMLKVESRKNDHRVRRNFLEHAFERKVWDIDILRVGGFWILESVCVFASEMTAKQTGVCKWFDLRKGMGFIKPDGENPDVFVHYSNLKSDGFAALYKNQRVAFDTALGFKDRINATNVTNEDGSLLVAKPIRERKSNLDTPADESAPKAEKKPREPKAKRETPKSNNTNEAKPATAAAATSTGENSKRRSNRRGKQGGRAAGRNDKTRDRKPTSGDEVRKPFVEWAELVDIKTKALNAFKTHFTGEPSVIGYASGRVNLIGGQIIFFPANCLKILICCC
jgi:CspA family cold shock protein